ncbi:MAG: hypothetical protein ACJAV2_004831 [Myxococcota bacterium]|jgi:hypothetical protein
MLDPICQSNECVRTKHWASYESNRHLRLVVVTHGEGCPARKSPVLQALFTEYRMIDVSDVSLSRQSL